MSLQVTKLTNGLTVATDTMKDAASVALGIWIGVGTRDETASQHGVAHLVEHMVFKGTAKRTAYQIAADLEDVGGYLNAYTSREETAYHARVLPKDVPLALDIISDMVLAPTFPADELERERGVIIQEIGQYQDSPDDHVFDLLQQGVYPQHPMGRNILGTIGTIASSTETQLREWLSTHYHANNMWLVASGNIAHADFVQLAEKFLGAHRTGIIQPRTAPSYQAATVHTARQLEQLHIASAWPGLGYTHPQYHAMQILMTVLAGGMSSRLFQEVREKRGLVYAISMGNNPARDSGLVTLYAGTSPEQQAEVQRVVAAELARLPNDLNEAEVNRAKTQMLAAMTMANDSIGNRCEQLAYQLMIHGRPVPLAERLAKIQAVPMADLLAVYEQLQQPVATYTLGQLNAAA